MLRVFLHSSWRVGLDGRWDAAPEAVDWLATALRCATDIAELSPDRYELTTVGRLGLPSVNLRSGERRFVLVHPFWAKKAAMELVDDGFEGGTLFVDTFQAARRPQRVLNAALEFAQRQGIL